MRVNIGIIGYGYWGPNLVRNFVETQNANVVMISDLRPARLAAAALKYPHIKTSIRHEDIFEDKTIDAVVIVTPVFTHYDLALKAIEAGKHVLITKPLTSTAEQGQRLVDAAEKRNQVLMLDHTFIYTGAVKKIKEVIDSGQIGQIMYYDSVRINLGIFQPDVNVIWDLAVHDLSIMEYVLGVQPTAVSATGLSHVRGKPENIAFLTCFFEANLIAHFHVNWLAPVKIRRTLIGGDQKMIAYDDLEPDEKIKIYDKGISVKNRDGAYELMVDYRAGDMWAPRLDRSEALAVEASHFLDCIRTQKVPLTDGHSGVRLVRILEAADKSLAAGGAPIKV